MNLTISCLRNIAIIAIVMHHSMVAFCGWPPNHAIGGEIPPISYLFSTLLKNLGLGVFTFISGYVLYYQAKKEENAVSFIKKKANRILFPCFFWAFVYRAFFSSYMYSTWPAIINGTHLWYLPMLFLCVLVTASHFYVRHAYALIGGCYIIILMLAVLTHFRTFIEFYIYFPVFYAGFLAHKYRIERYIYDNKEITCMFLLGGNFMDFSDY